MSIQVVNIQNKLSLIHEYWNPHIAGELNGQHVKLAKLQGEFVMHNHQDEDELFLVIYGELQIELENEILTIAPGEFVIIPKGINHKPICANEVGVLLFEPASTLNTGNQHVEGLTRDKLNSI
jgi:mannose-6-phosphate isomerase-like protein (cupin superfamily)